MANRTVFVVYRWDNTEIPELLSAWSSEDRANEELSKLQSDTPESTLYVLATNLTPVDGSE